LVEPENQPAIQQPSSNPQVQQPRR
jgi:hypothetical protein